MKLRSYRELAAGERFRMKDGEYPHFLKVDDGLADVVPDHRLHPKAPKAGFIHMEAGAWVHSFSDLPLHERRHRGFISPMAAMVELARSFPSLAPFYASPLAEWNPDALCTAAGKFTTEQAAVARFLLHLWQPGARWPCGKFNFIQSVRDMTIADRKAFADWTINPWWP